MRFHSELLAALGAGLKMVQLFLISVEFSCSGSSIP